MSLSRSRRWWARWRRWGTMLSPRVPGTSRRSRLPLPGFSGGLRLRGNRRKAGQCRDDHALCERNTLRKSHARISSIRVGRTPQRLVTASGPDARGSSAGLRRSGDNGIHTKPRARATHCAASKPRCPAGSGHPDLLARAAGPMLRCGCGPARFHIPRGLISGKQESGLCRPNPSAKVTEHVQSCSRCSIVATRGRRPGGCVNAPTTKPAAPIDKYHAPSGSERRLCGDSTSWPSRPARPAISAAHTASISASRRCRTAPAAAAWTTKVLERFVRDYIQSVTGDEVVFSWQGGEPTLRGLDFFRKVVALQRKHAKAGQRIENDLQTNGTLLDEDWARFLKEHRFLVGLSIDGPRENPRSLPGHPARRTDLRCRGCGGQGAAALRRQVQHADLREPIQCLAAA